MTVGELLEKDPFCDSIEVVVRDDGCGRWIQGYRIGKDVEQFKCEYTIEFQEIVQKDGSIHKWGKHMDGKALPYMTSGEIRDVYHGLDLPMKIIKKPVEHIPNNIANLQVCHFVPRHIPSMHKEQLTHLEHTLDINAYPEGWVPEENTEKHTGWEHLDGQMSIFDM